MVVVLALQVGTGGWWVVGLSPGWWLVVAPHPVPGSVYIADSNVGLQDCLNQGFLELACRIRVVLDTMRSRASHDQPRWMEKDFVSEPVHSLHNTTGSILPFDAFPHPYFRKQEAFYTTCVGIYFAEISYTVIMSIGLGTSTNALSRGNKS